MSRPLRVVLVAGEISGDVLGAGLMNALKAKHAHIEFAGIGGDLMLAEGLRCWTPMERLSVMGISEVLGRLPELLRIRKNCFTKSIEFQPDVFIGIDAPDFNLGLEKRLKKAGIKTIHYVSPSVWAWRKGRLKGIRQSVNHMLTLLPFEADFYKAANIPVSFVGHTLADQLPIKPNVLEARRHLGLTEHSQILAVLPGSRGAEVSKLLPLFLETAASVREQISDLTVLIPAANQKRFDQITEMTRDYSKKLNIQISLKQADEVIASANAVLVASGTATLQTLLLKKPMVVAYKMSAFSYWLISSLAVTPWVALPNILEKRMWVPERLQGDATVEQLSSDVLKALNDEDYREAFEKRAQYWHEQLALNANESAALAVLSVINA